MEDLDLDKYTDQLVKDLRKIDLLNELDRESINALISQSKFKAYEKGERIIKDGDYDSWFYFLISGSVAIEKDGKVLGRLKRCGDMFGELGIVDGSPRSSSVIASEDHTRCFALDASILGRLAKPGRHVITSLIYRALAEAMANQLRSANEKIISLESGKKG